VQDSSWEAGLVRSAEVGPEIGSAEGPETDVTEDRRICAVTTLVWKTWSRTVRTARIHRIATVSQIEEISDSSLSNLKDLLTAWEPQCSEM
jgi:hypothetical protein